jgi:predicted esterase
MPLAYVAAAPPAADAGGTKPGLLLLLHGSGDDEYGLLPLGAGVAPGNFQVVSLRAPVSCGFGGHRWFEGMSAEPEPIALESTIASSCDKQPLQLYRAVHTVGMV